MTDLANKVQNTLDETRMLTLGCQVLLGFQLRSAFEPLFDRLPVEARFGQIVGLGLLLVTIGLLISASTFHQIVEHGRDSGRVIEFGSRVAGIALLPFAIDMGLDGLTVVDRGLGRAAALGVFAVTTLFALAMWYGVGFVVRAGDRSRSRRRSKESSMARRTDLSTRIRQVLTEARVVLPGAQALLGFQLAAVLTEVYGQLAPAAQLLHLVSLALVGVATVLLMAPAAFHRVVEDGEDTERMYRFASRMVLLSLVPLALGVALDTDVVAARVVGEPAAAAMGGTALIFFYAMWFGLPLVVRQRVRDANGSEDQAVRRSA